MAGHRPQWALALLLVLVCAAPAAAASDYQDFREKLDRGKIALVTIYPTTSQLEYADDGGGGTVSYPRGREDEIIKAVRAADLEPAIVDGAPAGNPLDSTTDEGQPWPLFVLGIGLVLASVAVTVKLVRSMRPQRP